MTRRQFLLVSAFSFAILAIAATYPNGLAALVADVRGIGDADEVIKVEEQVRERLSARARLAVGRRRERERVIETLIAGRIDFAGAIEQFTEVNSNDPYTIDMLRFRFGDLPPDALAALSVLSHLESCQGEIGVKAIFDRACQQFESRFGIQIYSDAVCGVSVRMANIEPSAKR